ncbi:DUF2752 domain-containing protein [Leifsonia bigeumensis]|uniref:DUF2752 domain-containing protein n=1 Tax=Leifsonella bigeumensis TaxID=433643 RepID=A0ABP7F6U9_9MICO
MRVRDVGGRVRRHPLGVSLGAGAVVLHAGAVAFFSARNPYAETIFPPCPLLHLTGWQCPGCGGTRSLYSLLHGDLLGSLAMNPLVVAGYLAVAVSLVGVVAGRRGKAGVATTLYWIAAAIAIGATVYSGVLRNLIV